MYTITIEVFSTHVISQETNSKSSRIEKELYQNIAEEDVSNILTSWSDNDDILMEWINNGMGNLDKVIETEISKFSKHKFKVQVIKST